ncbi:MAG: hypothetical protein M1824_004394 [Vezdaea acicularis]|nr:MAG: hypothetical protein M1824_004394 [Vezdaea acicularis]
MSSQSVTVPIKALVFDVFGTVVDWRASVTAALSKAISPKLTLLHPSLEVDFAVLSQAWRDSYGHFTQGFDPEKDEWVSIDEHHLRSLDALLLGLGIRHSFSDEEVKDLSLPDSTEGLKRLNGLGLQTATLSNGNLSLLRDLAKHGNLAFKHFFSAEQFRAYKPHPRVYLGAVEKLGLKPEEVAMVAAHLGDLEAARQQGLRCIYVEREGEEEYHRVEVAAAKREGWCDVWVAQDEGGLVEVAMKLKELGHGK